MPRRKQKRPRHSITVPAGKVPKSRAEATNNQKCLNWTFAIFDNYAWHDDTTHCVRALAKKLQDYERMTWAEVKRRDHPVPLPSLVVAARNRLGELGQDDVSEVWRLRFTGKQRLWGLRQGEVFQVLWWDPEHKVCSSKKKHT